MRGGAGFTPHLLLGIVLAAVLLSVGPTFFLSMQVGDATYYLMMAHQIAQGVAPVVRIAENAADFHYAFGVSVLYAPAMLISDDFSHRFVLVAALNIAAIVLYSWLSTRYVIRALPGFAAWGAMAAVSALLLLDARWQYAAMMANSDILPALFTLVLCLLGNHMAQAHVCARTRAWSALAIIGLGAVGFWFKISLAAVALAAMFVGLRRVLSPALCWGAGAVLVLVLAAALTQTLLWDTYFNALLGYVAGKPVLALVFDQMSNLLFSALPSRIIPNFNYVFISEIFRDSNTFGVRQIRPAHTLPIAIALAVDALIVIGAYRLRRRCGAEILALAVCLPFFMAVTNATTRYLMAFQAPLLLFFLAGAQAAFQRAKPVLPKKRLLWLGGALGAVVLVVSVQSVWVRSRAAPWSFIGDTAAVFGGVRDRLHGLDPARSRLIAVTGPFGSEMWLVASDITQYLPDPALPDMLRRHDIYMVVACARRDCAGFDSAVAAELQKVSDFAAIKADTVEEWRQGAARARLIRLTPAEDKKALSPEGGQSRREQGFLAPDPASP